MDYSQTQRSRPQPAAAYHRQFAAQPRHRWFGPILVIGLAAVFYLVLLLGELIAFAIWAAVNDGRGGDFDTVMDSLVGFNNVSGLVFGMLTIILMWPAVELATRCVYRQWFSSMLSVVDDAAGSDAAGHERRRGLRWRLLGRYLLLALLVWFVCAAVIIAASPGPAGELRTGITWNGHVLVMLIAMLLLVPVQAMSEEIVFRGLAMNVIGSWLRHPAWAVLIPVPFFVFGHVYDLPGLIDVGVFAIVIGALTIRTGGLEAGIAFHIVNNLLAFGLGILAGADLDATSAPAIEVVLSIAVPIIFAALVIVDERRRRLRSDAPTSEATQLLTELRR